MSFSYKVKEELFEVMPQARHCRLAELAALISACGKIYIKHNGDHYIRVSSENKIAIQKCQNLIYKTFDYMSDSFTRYNSESHNMTYMISIKDSEIALKILMATKIMGPDGSFDRHLALISTVGLNNLCCKRAFLRGMFIASGSISDPEKSYHLEIVTQSKRKAEQIAAAINSFELDAHIVIRRNNNVVYLKEGEQIVDMLNVLGARLLLLELENVRILKEVRNSINRKVNCEAANLNKTVNAAVRQAEDIQYIADTKGLESLNDGLYEIARLRLQYPDMSLKDLGALLDPPVGKSGVNHRLRKISEIAEDLRKVGGR